MDSELTPSLTYWQAQVAGLRATLDELQPQLIEAEARLSDRLAAISAFEFQVRARLEPLTRRLDELQHEIDGLRRQLRQLQSWYELEDKPATFGNAQAGWNFDSGDGAAASGSYRYRQPAPEPPATTLAADELAALKQLYRQLARRFHPDLALDEADRAHRTQLMMAINTAYAMGDLRRLELLALEPDSISNLPDGDEALAAALEREIERCRARLAEIERELATLDNHDSARLMRRAERAAAEGRDLLEEMARDLRGRVSERRAERDILQNQLEEAESDDLDAGDLADLVYDLGLEQAGADDWLETDGDWRPRTRRGWDFERAAREEDDILDDAD